MVLNRYFGLPFLGVDDIVWATNPKNSSEKYMFFTDPSPFSSLAYPNSTALPQPQLPTAVYRWDPQERILLPVISRNELNPSGIRVSPDQKKLYVTDESGIVGLAPVGAAAKSWLGPYVYSYDLDEDVIPDNRNLFAQVRQGIADDIHVDDEGRVWTAESEGVVVRSANGKVLEIFNSQYFQQGKAGDAVAIANFALAVDVLVVQVTNRLWRVQLNEAVVGRSSSIVN